MCVVSIASGRWRAGGAYLPQALTRRRRLSSPSSERVVGWNDDGLKRSHLHCSHSSDVCAVTSFLFHPPFLVVFSDEMDMAKLSRDEAIEQLQLKTKL